MEKFIKEMEILQSVDHPNIMSARKLYYDDTDFFIETDVAEGGELDNRIISVKFFTERKAAYMAYQILSGIKWMHSNNMTHRDLKPQNILMTSADPENLDLKITDFGFSCFYEPG